MLAPCRARAQELAGAHAQQAAAAAAPAAQGAQAGGGRGGGRRGAAAASAPAGQAAQPPPPLSPLDRLVLDCQLDALLGLMRNNLQVGVMPQSSGLL